MKNLILDIGHSEWIKKDNPLETEIARLFANELQDLAQLEMSKGINKEIVSVIIPDSIVGIDSNSALNAKIHWANENIAKYGNEDIYFSIHCNWSNGNKTAVGWNIYHKSLDTAPNMNRALYSKKLAEHIGNSLIANSFKSFGQGVCPDSMTAVKSLGVCTYIHCPSCLIELGFLSTEINKNDLQDKVYRASMVKSVYEGIKTYFNI